MGSPRILAPEPNALAGDLAKVVIDAQNKALAAKGRFDVAISGGSLINVLADGLIGHKEVQWPKWRVWLADERIVPLDHADSNWGAFKQHVVDKLPENDRPVGFTLNPEMLARIDHEPYGAFAADYLYRLVEELGPHPALDLALLGMGPDGHTCSLFPGHPLLDEKLLYVAALDDSPKPPKQRITLTKPALALVDKIVFVATGAGKKDAIHRVFTVGDESLPAKQVTDIAKNEVIWFTDAAALGN